MFWPSPAELTSPEVKDDVPHRRASSYKRYSANLDLLLAEFMSHNNEQQKGREGLADDAQATLTRQNDVITTAPVTCINDVIRSQLCQAEETSRSDVTNINSTLT
ncbi:hypothetical protein V1264_012841 [Littorina saxatilis]|uniref:Uncharacterized protein n=1 Tax=Littorina saxatilis TaxID=31220 RepID=A0AAN9BY91_9CAEN